MKARRRHELKENVLAHELVRLKEFFSAYGSWIFVAVLLAAVALLVVTQLRSRQRQQYTAEKAQFDRLMNEPDMAPEDRLSGLADMAGNAQDAVIGAQAAIHVGNTYLNKFINARDQSSREAQDLLAQARSAYQLVLDRHNRQGKLKNLAAQARFGLGEVCENLGDFEAAKAHYEAIAALTEEKEPIARDALQQLKLLPQMATSVPFATTRPAEATTEPGEGATTAPAEKPAATAPAKTGAD